MYRHLSYDDDLESIFKSDNIIYLEALFYFVPHTFSSIRGSPCRQTELIVKVFIPLISMFYF